VQYIEQLGMMDKFHLSIKTRATALFVSTLQIL
jgi:hypothetical protein